MQLFPRDKWFTAIFNDEPRSTEIYCDITTPVEFSEDVFTMIDLDLDVIKKRTGRSTSTTRTSSRSIR